jgi:1-acyl-sn-glycerol-3-phosphate acyltransferase
MQFFKSILFVIFLNLWGMIIPIIYFPSIIFQNSKLADHGAKIWSIVGLWVLKKLCKIDYQILGEQYIPRTPAIIACKHQSAWETIVMHMILHRPVYAYKKELRKIPFYGWFLYAMSGIAVDRKGGASALKEVIRQTKKFIAKKQIVVIFPQGTRVKVGGNLQEFPYQSGIVALYMTCDVDVVPVALNSGIFWPKYQILKKPGTIKIEFLEPIKTGLSKKEFLEKLQNDIEEKTAILEKNIS